jgi:hypothetical protein
MANIIRGMLFACACAGLLATAAPALAQTLVIGPYPYVRAYGPYIGPYGPYVGAYGGYGYSYHRFGFDPDPNVRLEISRTRNWRKG